MSNKLNQNHYYSRKQIKEQLRAENNGTIPANEFIVHKNVEDEVNRLRDMSHIVAGENLVIDPDTFKFLGWKVLFHFGAMAIRTHTRPGTLALTRTYRPKVALFVGVCAFARGIESCRKLAQCHRI